MNPLTGGIMTRFITRMLGSIIYHGAAVLGMLAIGSIVYDRWNDNHPQ
jgi:hypothetical protein